MNNLKCPKCGLVNFAHVTVCKRCNNTLANAPAGTSSFQPSAGTSSTHHQPANIQPSFISIIKNDYAALLGVIFPLIGCGLYFATNVLGLSFTSRSGTSLAADNAGHIFLALALGLTLLGVALLVWRVKMLQEVFANGQEVVGHITNLSFFKDRGRVEYSYTFNQQTYQSGNAIMKNRQTEAFGEGREIVLIVTAANPRRAFIKDLYL